MRGAVGGAPAPCAGGVVPDDVALEPRPRDGHVRDVHPEVMQVLAVVAPSVLIQHPVSGGELEDAVAVPGPPEVHVPLCYTVRLVQRDGVPV